MDTTQRIPKTRLVKAKTLREGDVIRPKGCRYTLTVPANWLPQSRERNDLVELVSRVDPQG